MEAPFRINHEAPCNPDCTKPQVVTGKIPGCRVVECLLFAVGFGLTEQQRSRWRAELPIGWEGTEHWLRPRHQH